MQFLGADSDSSNRSMIFPCFPNSAAVASIAVLIFLLSIILIISPSLTQGAAGSEAALTVTLSDDSESISIPLLPISSSSKNPFFSAFASQRSLLINAAAAPTTAPKPSPPPLNN